MPGSRGARQKSRTFRPTIRTSNFQLSYEMHSLRQGFLFMPTAAGHTEQRNDKDRHRKVGD
jgi:hypothetical protein